MDASTMMGLEPTEVWPEKVTGNEEEMQGVILGLRLLLATNDAARSLQIPYDQYLTALCAVVGGCVLAENDIKVELLDKAKSNDAIIASSLERIEGWMRKTLHCAVGPVREEAIRQHNATPKN